MLRREPGTEIAPGSMEFCWLIERGQALNHAPTVWWTADESIGWGGWTDDPHKAMKYARREDAEKGVLEHQAGSITGFGWTERVGRLQAAGISEDCRWWLECLAEEGPAMDYARELLTLLGLLDAAPPGSAEVHGDAAAIREALTRTYAGSSGGWKVPWSNAKAALAALDRLLAAHEETKRCFQSSTDSYERSLAAAEARADTLQAALEEISHHYPAGTAARAVQVARAALAGSGE